MNKTNLKQEKWLHFDERLDVLCSLKMFNDLAHLSNSDRCHMKWSILSLHSALQGMMAFHLSLGNDFFVMGKRDLAKWLEAHEAGTEYPVTRMDTFLNLYEKIQKHEIAQTRFNPTEQQTHSVKKIHEFRKEFTHFMPQHWSIEVSGLTDLFEDCLDIIKLLGDVNKPRWQDQKQYQQFSRLIEKSYAQIKASLRVSMQEP